MLVAVSLLVLPIMTTTARTIQEKHIKDNSHWQKLAEFTVQDSDTEVSKYKSEKTGEIQD